MSSIETNIPAPSNWTRFWGGLKTLGGVAEIVAGGGIAYGSGGLAAAAGGTVGAHGIDTSISGLRQLVSGFEDRTYTSEIIGNLTGSEITGEIADSGIGLVGTLGSSLLKVTKGFSEIFVPKSWQNKIWRFGELDYGTLGATDPVGNIIIQNGLKGKELEHVLDHEMVHRWFSPGPVMQELRAQISAAGYENSQLLRFSEEAIAETIASGSLKQGFWHPLKNPYGITKKGLALEGSVLADIIKNGADFGAKLNDDK